MVNWDMKKFWSDIFDPHRDVLITFLFRIVNWTLELSSTSLDLLDWQDRNLYSEERRKKEGQYQEGQIIMAL